MKKIIAVLIAVFVFAGCSGLPTSLSLKENLNKAVDTKVKSVERKVVFSLSGKEVNQETIVEAVTAGDYDALNDLLGNVDDVRTLVADDVLLLHLAEKHFPMVGAGNAVTELLVEKKAWILQRDDRGNSFPHAMNGELAGSPRWEFANNLVGDKIKRFYEVLKADDLAAMEAFTAYTPVDGRFLLDAVHAKAGKITAWALDKGVSPVGLADRKGEPVLHMACDSYPSTAVFDNRLEMVQALIDAGLGVNETDGKGMTPLRMLMEADGKDQGDKMGSPVQLAELLIKNGADINIADSQGKTPLVRAIEIRKPVTVETLLKSGAVISDGDYSANGISECAEILLKYGADPAKIAYKISSVMPTDDLLKLIDLLLSKGCSVNAFDLNNLCYNFEVARYLIDKGADISDSNILLSTLQQHPEDDKIIYLAAHGADLSRVYLRGKTLLHFAVRNKRMEVVQLCIEKGIDLNVVDESGKTPLDTLPTSSRYDEMRNLITAAGAKSASAL